MFEHLVTIYRSWVIARPKLTLMLVCLLALGMASGLTHLKLDASSDSLTLEHDSDLDYFREMNQRYQSGDFLIVTFRPEQDLFSDASIDLMKQLSDDLSQVPGVVSILSMLDAPLLYSPKISLGDIDEARTLLTPGVDRQAAKKEYLNSPLYKNLLLGPDGQTTALMLNLQVDNRYLEMVRHRDALRLKRSQDGLSSAEVIELERVTREFRDYRTEVAARDHQRVQLVRDVVAGYQDRAQLFVGGATMITADMIDFIKSDLRIFGIGVLAFMIIVMAIIFRQKRFVILPILSSMTAVLIMLGFLSWIDWRLTVISSNFVALLLIISLAITIHLLVRYREFHKATPDAPQAELVMNTVAFMALPCLYTTLTTMVAFASLVVSNIRPVIDFGWMMSIGLAVSLILSFVIIPAGLMILPKGEPKDKGDNSAAFTLLFSRFTQRHSNLVLWLSVLIAIVSVYGVSRLEVENKFIDYFHESTEIYQGMYVIDKNLGGTITLDITLDAPDEEPLYTASAAGEDDPFAETGAELDPFASADSFDEEDPFGEADPFNEQSPDQHSRQDYWFTSAGVAEISKLQNYLDALPEVGKVQSLATAYEVASDINGAPLNDFEMALIQKSLPEEVSSVMFDPYLAEDIEQTRITLRVKETYPGLRRAELLEKIRQYTINELGFDADKVHFSGLLVLYNNMLQSLYKSQIVTLGAVFIGIVLMFVVLFRSIVMAIIAIVPNLLAAATVLGGMGLAGVPLDMMTITIAAITVGIGVDDTIHYIHRYKKEFAVDGDYIAAMHRSHASIGRAMFYTSVIIVVGFSILALSNFIPTIYFGLLTSFAMLAAILAALTLLPRLILLVKPLGKPQLDHDPLQAQAA
ncbi:MMPL family transporter [Aestuariicella hydrocarbonica]|uniref:MMPL family transporter n=1 Tax=Pseudomaricurvus hydrocarbonicus TaxID=1470433 RepID=A0A9E5JTR8_9GAMM|nr:MMPL family transporter [Aestuariicella hydrocarbonica]NHO64376.1 MMPL family transporter [Aestuariicella hydrocarbonica]